MTRTTITIILLTFLTLTGLGQDKKSSNLKNECFSNNNYENNSVDKFKDQLTVKIEMRMLKVGKTTEKTDFQYSETIQNESSLIQLNDTIAIKVSVTRAVDFKVKKYLYKVDMFTKTGKCWKAASGIGLWNEFYPGVVTGGWSVGFEGTSSYLGFDGTIIIE